MTHFNSVPQENQNELLTTEEVAAYLRLSVQALRVRLHRGHDLPPYIRIGQHYRWRRADVDDWVTAQVEQLSHTSGRSAGRKRGRPRRTDY